MAKKSPRKALSKQAQVQLLETLKTRFESHRQRHQGLQWQPVQAKLESRATLLWSLEQMELTGGEPDVIGFDKQTGEFIFVDCAPESPPGRRSICYDRAGLESRKEHQPAHNAVDLAAEMGIEMLSEHEYRNLQELGEFDLKTSSWIKTPAEVRKLGGALFCDRRYGQVFLYHNGAQSYYSVRGFRGSLRV